MESGNTPQRTSAAIRLDLSELICSIQGILKLFQLCFNLIGLCLIQASGDYSRLSRSEFYTFVSAAGLCITFFLLFLYIFHVVEKYRNLPWLKVELVYCVIWTVFYLIAGLLTVGLINGYLNIAGYFGFAAMAAYGLEACHKIWNIISNRSPQ